MQWSSRTEQQLADMVNAAPLEAEGTALEREGEPG